MTTKKLPRNWSLCTLGDTAEYLRGVTFSKKEQLKTETSFSIKIATTKAAQENGINHKDLYFIPKNIVKNKEQILLYKDILVSIANSLPLVGRATFITEKDKGITFGAFMGLLRAQKEIILPELLYCFLQSDNAKNYFRVNARTTTNISNLSSNTLLSYKIPLPPIHEQHRIVEKIEKLFKQIDSSVASLQKTQEKIAQFRESLIDKVLNSLPSNTFLGEILKPKRERIIPNEKNKDIIFIGMDCIEPNSLFPFKTYTLSDTKSSCFAFSKNDVLYGRMRSYLNKVFKAEFDGTASAEFIVFPPTGKILPDYLKYVLHQRRFVKFASRNASGDRPRVTFEDDLSQFGLFIPSLPEQRKIVAEIEKQFAAADKMQKAVDNALENAKKLKQAILKKAFNGELVPQDPKDQPAAALLTKIKAERAAKSKTNLKQSKRIKK